MYALAWYILWQVGTFYGHFGIFFPFWYVAPRKIWQPWGGPLVIASASDTKDRGFDSRQSLKRHSFASSRNCE
jgi:hypothetical protein